jgi:hypothetical protein
VLGDIDRCDVVIAPEIGRRAGGESLMALRRASAIALTVVNWGSLVTPGSPGGLGLDGLWRTGRDMI